MSRNKNGGYAAKHPKGTELNSEIKSAIETKAADNGLTCAAAHGIAETLGVSPADVGVTLDLMDFRILKCQLGLFGYKPHKKIVAPAESVSNELKSALQGALVDNRLPCADCWAIADRMGIKRMAASAACEALKIKISPCQLGAF